ncbi:all-trans retinoic acid-induced differentiation factor [Microcaecilia unicolor]|uniref:All-trans retinoic acid-induced differentiation factor n=1 Tax=Microcaecilia unicolor TaxID=1415580 RepID=A0A6P7XFY0_9AMPH|nr:all-trans retinoic acid-induced differentiation factor [Microcaecilia unicolor]
MAAVGSFLGWHGWHLLLILAAVSRVMIVAGFLVQQVCSRCPGDLRNGSEVASWCHSNLELEIKGRCCLRRQGDSEDIVGLDLWNCSLTHLDNELQNARTAVILDLSENPLQNVSDSFFQGFIFLQYLALPLTLDCPGGNASWKNISVDTSERICSRQKDSCNNTAQLTLLCPENSLCAPDGPGMSQCLCADGFHGYKCVREGSFPTFMFFGILGFVTAACSLLLWCTQRRKVKST